MVFMRKEFGEITTSRLACVIKRCIEFAIILERSYFQFCIRCEYCVLLSKKWKIVLWNSKMDGLFTFYKPLLDVFFVLIFFNFL